MAAVFVRSRRGLPVVVLAMALCVVAAAADPPPPAGAPAGQSDAGNQGSPPQASDTNKPQGDKAATDAENEQVVNATRYTGHFLTAVLAGGARNDLSVPVPAAQLQDFDAGFTWGERPPAAAKPDDACRPSPPGGPRARVVSVTPDTDFASTQSMVGVEIPALPRWWPPRQIGYLELCAYVPAAGKKVLFKGPVQVSGMWLPLLVTLVAVAIIYPGSAMATCYLRWRRRRRQAENGDPQVSDTSGEPSLIASLDPVQITAGQFGHASIAKLQIYLFSIIVFAMLLFYQMRCGVLAGLSWDIMLLLGISGAGAAGGKITYTLKQRLSLASYAWARRVGWLAPERDNVQPRARWSELFLDHGTKEFDPYGFQMAVFSIVVAVALIQTSLAALGTFTISPQMLALLGLSQVVFVGGKALENTGVAELDQKIREVMRSEDKYLADKAALDAKPDDADLKAKVTADLAAFRTDVVDAAEMFWSVYGDVLTERPQSLDDADKLVPGEKHS